MATTASEALALKETKENTESDASVSVDEEDLVVEVDSEQHKPLGDLVKSIIFGGLDGIITTFAIVASVVGAHLETEVIIVLGFANLIADGLSMGVGDYLSEMSEIEYINSERDREEWEFEQFKEGEIQEMIAIYKEKGIGSEDAENILRRMGKYPKLFIDHMLLLELELQPCSGDETPMKNGFVTLISFLCFGSVPLLSWVALAAIEFDKDSFDPTFLISCVMTVITLFGLGVFKGKLTESPMIKSGVFITFNGVFAAGAAYLIAYALSHLTGVN